MPRPYRNGKATQLRAGGGQFRRATLRDFGVGTVICTKCGALNPYDLMTLETENGFVHQKRNDPPTICAGCGEKLKE